MASDTRGRRSTGFLPVLLLVVLFLAAVTVYAVSVLREPGDKGPAPAACTATADGVDYRLTPGRTSTAALIAGISVRRGMPARAASIAVATAIQESGLRNLNYGDDAGPDSRGLFQQRPSQGWGSEEQVMDPVYAANAFYDALEKVPNYADLPLTVAAQTVQRSAFPDAYADHEAEAKAFASALTGHSPASLTCTLPPPSTSGSPDAVLAAMSAVYGPVDATVEGDRITVAGTGAYGWSLAQWAVANAEALSLDSVAFDERRWTRATGTWDPAPAQGSAVVITVHRAAEQS
ncbi:hypothetical protein MUG94_13095 [Arthrobacter gengyunqii]|uniref:Heavy metal transporter n=1 Tax=Arthrobacter gengyunqii TaxID=2886940 RepID=A0A9X1LZ48_9MICC|nr:hypothetical protein [Arthrobacter gengyunqii]MCC3268051.1 hypothetical protein [Arthrobacter gengyunqii]UOY95469.1 hypothetical protein MUG94_13095 [Arthrobacter gengyunqii]